MPTKKQTIYLMYGYNKDDINDIGYYSADNSITDDEDNAMVFYAKKQPFHKNFGTPKKWLNLINDDEDLNHGFKFHLVKREKQI